MTVRLSKKPETLYFTCWGATYGTDVRFSNIIMSKHPLEELAYRERTRLPSALISWRELTAEEFKIYSTSR